MPNALRCMIQVTAGLIVDRPMPEYSKQWSLDSITLKKIQDGDPAAAQLWQMAIRESLEYTEELENPGVINWVIRSWIWL